MERGPCIVLLGDSVLMDSLADYLADRSLSGVHRTTSTNFDDQIDILKPNLILLEMGRPYSDQVISLLQQRPGMAIIGLDLDSSQAIVLGSYQRIIGTMEDLYKVIETEIQKQNACYGEVNEMR